MKKISKLFLLSSLLAISAINADEISVESIDKNITINADIVSVESIDKNMTINADIVSVDHRDKNMTINADIVSIENIDKNSTVDRGVIDDNNITEASIDSIEENSTIEEASVNNREIFYFTSKATAIFEEDGVSKFLYSNTHNSKSDNKSIKKSDVTKEDLWLSFKSTSKSVAGMGEFVQYLLKIENSTQVMTDPVNKASYPKAIPGAVVLKRWLIKNYTKTLTSGVLKFKIDIDPKIEKFATDKAKTGHTHSAYGKGIHFMRHSAKSWIKDKGVEISGNSITFDVPALKPNEYTYIYMFTEVK